MEIYRVRVRLTDSPGRLGAAAVALGEFGINILDVDVHSIDGRMSADDLVLELTMPLDLPVVEHALRQADCELLHLERVDPHELTDSLTRALELAHSLAGGAVDDDLLAETARVLVRADAAWIVTADGDGSQAAGAIVEAARRATPVQRREPIDQLPSWGGAPWVLAIPFRHRRVRRLLVLARRSPTFSFTETARAQALLRFVAVPVNEAARDEHS